MLAKHLFQDRELFTLRQCLPKQSTVTLHSDTQQEQWHPGIYLQDASVPGCGPGTARTPFHSYLYIWVFPSHILCGWASKAACKNRAETDLNLLLQLAPSPGLKGLHALPERFVGWEAMVETTAFSCALIPVLNATLLINFLVTTLGSRVATGNLLTLLCNSVCWTDVFGYNSTRI